MKNIINEKIKKAQMLATKPQIALNQSCTTSEAKLHCLTVNGPVCIYGSFIYVPTHHLFFPDFSESTMNVVFDVKSLNYIKTIKH